MEGRYCCSLQRNEFKIFRITSKFRAHIFSKCGHWTQIEKKDEFAELCENFFLRATN